jgi:diguanylate cyclase (GGDEF)-like protein
MISIDLQTALIGATMSYGLLALCLLFVANTARGVPGILLWAAGFGMNFGAMVAAQFYFTGGEDALGATLSGLEFLSYLLLLLGHCRFLRLAPSRRWVAAGGVLSALGVALAMLRPEESGYIAVAAMAMAGGLLLLIHRSRAALSGMFLGGVGFSIYGALRLLTGLEFVPRESGLNVYLAGPALNFVAGMGLVVMVMQLLVAQRRGLAERNRRQAEALRAVFDAMAQGVVVVDAGGVLVAANESGARLSDLEEIQRIRFTDWLPRWAEARGLDGAAIMRRLNEDCGKESSTIELPEVEGQAIQLRRDRRSEGGFVLTLTDVTETRRLEMRLREMASTDALSGLSNRRYFMELAESELARAKRFKRMGTLLMIDIDHFKHINDTYGHPAGDKVIRALSATLGGQLRRVDFAGRLGGEEFAVLLPEIPPDKAREAAERLRRALRAQKVHTEKGDISFTVSIGLAGFDGEESLEHVLAKADSALYGAKRAGRDRVKIAAAA